MNCVMCIFLNCIILKYEVGQIKVEIFSYNRINMNVDINFIGNVFNSVIYRFVEKISFRFGRIM